jgi:peptidoglycan/LPS O-acetylase OafA/YrhL
MRTIGQRSISKSNNFDALRFIAASGVIFSHSFPVTQGSNLTEPLHVVSSGQSNIGEVCVMFFFVISGFLIAQSFTRSKGLVEYLSNRILRIIPGLAAVVLLTTFLVGPILTSSALSVYFADPKTYRYLGTVLIYPISQQLPGLFTNNIYRGVVNASLWTLCYEFTCYILLAAVGYYFRRAWYRAIFLSGFFIACLTLTYISPRIFFGYAGYFVVGSVLYLLRDRIPLDFRLFLVSVVILASTILLGFGFKAAAYLFGAYALIYLAFADWPRLYGFARYGDFSYGLYIFAFPVQQIVALLTTSWHTNFVISFPVILLLAALSWHFIEEPSLGHKGRVTVFLTRLLSAIQLRLFSLGSMEKRKR